MLLRIPPNKRTRPAADDINPPPGPIGVVVGLEAEARLARRWRVPVEVGGGTTQGAAEAAARLAPHVSALVSFGLAGGLDPALSPGTILVPTDVLDADESWTTDSALNETLGSPTPHTLVGGGPLLATAAAKRAARETTGAAAVDLESAAVARAAASYGIPFAVLRAIVDPATLDLPLAALVALDTKGRISLVQVAVAALANPRELPALLALPRHAARARRALLGRVPHHEPASSPPMTLKPAQHYPAMADPQAQPRYTGIPTFFRTPYSQDLAQTDIALIGVPFDGGVTNRPGARHGPREVRLQSTLLRTVNTATDQAPFADHRVRDLGDCWIERPYELQGALAEIEAFYHQVVDAGVTPITVGGDHSIAWPILRAVARHGPIGMVHIDAHGDTGDDYMGSRYHHGTPFRRAVDDNLLDPTRVIQIGLRGTSTVRGSLWAFSEQAGMRVMPMDELHDRGWRWAVEEARRIVGAGPAYLSFDIDSLDPVFAPGTGTPEAGGITMIEAQRIVRGLMGLDIVAADLVEVSPPFDHADLTAFHGASILFEILCVAAAARAARGTPI